MKRHVLHPLWLAIALVAVILAARAFVVPEDFGVHGDSFTYNFYRKANVQEWKDFPVKYRGRERCARCHDGKTEQLLASKHLNVECESCHGPGAGHPREIKKLPTDASREHCLRCHQELPYPSSLRSELPAVNGEKHMRKRECRKCHDPHYPNLEDT